MKLVIYSLEKYKEYEDFETGLEAIKQLRKSFPKKNFKFELEE